MSSHDEYRIFRSRSYAEQILNAMHPGGRVLEFGSGIGLVGTTLQDNVDSVTFCDVDAQVLSDIEGETWQWNGLEPHNRDGTFDSVVAVLSLHHVPNLGQVLGNLYRLLASGGGLYVVELEPNEDYHRHLEDFDGYHGFDRGELASAIEAAGFSEVAIETAIDAMEGDASAFFISAQKNGDRT